VAKALSATERLKEDWRSITLDEVASWQRH